MSAGHKKNHKIGFTEKPQDLTFSLTKVNERYTFLLYYLKFPDNKQSESRINPLFPI